MENNTGLTIQPPEQDKFIPTGKETAAVIISYFAAYLYTYIFFSDWESQSTIKVFLTVFAVVFCAGVELLFRDRCRSAESFVWLACMWLMIIAVDFTENRVWGEYSYIIIHLFAVYWVCVRSGCTAGGGSSIYMPADCLRAFVIVPAKNFFFRIRTIWYGLTHRHQGRDKLTAAVFAAAAAVAGCIILFFAGRLLAAADDAFGRIVENVLNVFSGNFMEVIMRFALSLPIGAYLAGLAVGCNRQNPQTETQRGEKYAQSLKRVRKVPDIVWTVIVTVFCVFYAGFFAIQARYLFGAFSHTLPENFTVAQYARQGFFEMCRVMALNFLLLLLVMKTSVSGGRGLKIVSTVLLFESVLFAVVAMSKLVLYISCFGFTPLRLESSWLVFSLLSGCVFAGVNIWTGKRTFCPWLLLSAGAMSVLALI